MRPHVDKSAKPKSLPLGFINGELKLDQSQYQSQFSIGRSFYVTFSKEYSLFVGVNRISEDEKLADYYWFFTWQDTAAASPDYWTHKATKAEIYKKMKEAAKEFPEELRGVLDLTKEENILTPPLKLRTCTVESIPNGRVTLMGDAAHTVTPCTFPIASFPPSLLPPYPIYHTNKVSTVRGDGGNNAMKDAVNLIRQISKSDGTNLLQLVREYEKEMLPRAKEIVQLSRCGRTDEDEAVKEGLNIWKLSTTSGVQDMLRNKESWGSENDGGKEAYGTK